MSITTLWIAIGTLAIAFIAILTISFYYLRSLQKLRDEQGLQFLLSRVDEHTQRINNELGSLFRDLHEHLGRQNAVIEKTQGQLSERLEGTFGSMQHRLGRMEEAYRNLQGVSENISSWLESLRAPKLRGSTGELFLGDLLGQVLSPDQYTLQYTFRSGERVDAVIHFINGLVSVDSKFPLENFMRFIESTDEDQKKAYRKTFVQDVKRHVDNIATKYILPDEGTFDFALMYIPAENVYYETIIKDDRFGDDRSIASCALDRHVIPVSPNSFYAYLQAIVLGLKGLRIESRAKEILQRLQRLKGDFERFQDEYRKVGTHLRNATASYDKTTRQIDKFSDKLLATEAESSDKKKLVKEKVYG